MNENRVEYLVVGGYAVGYHGYPRATADLDIWVRMSRRNAGKIVKALEEFGFDREHLSLEAFTTKDQVVRMGRPPLQIEILTTISGVEFKKCHARRDEASVEELAVPLISLADLIANKEASGRPRDLDDLERLKPPRLKHPKKK